MTEPPPPSSSPPALRTPKTFDCAKAFLGVDFVICASPKLMDAMARLEDAYAAARAAKGDQVKTEQMACVRVVYGVDCGLLATGRPSATLI